MRNLFLLYISAIFLFGCATNQRRQFEQVKIGMEKNDVLMLMDSPQRTQRWQGKDRWTYVFYDENTRLEKEVHFLEGKADYVGEVFKPEVSAAEQDARNEASNQEVEAMAQTQKAETQKAYSDFETRAKGEDAVRYVPQFEPVQ